MLTMTFYISFNSIKYGHHSVHYIASICNWKFELLTTFFQFTLPHTQPSEKAMAPHSSTFAQKIPWMEEPGRLQSMRSLELDTTERLHFHFSLSCIGKGNGNPLQCSCLENPWDGEAWWAAVSAVIQSQTRLKRLSSSSIVDLFCYQDVFSCWVFLY